MHAISSANNAGVIEITSELTNDNYVSISFKDNGTGIDPDNIPKLFDAYYTTKDVGQGTGIGLYSVKLLLRSFQGLITVNSELGSYTVFVVRLKLG
jgi:signal transduction histidine kinase